MKRLFILWAALHISIACGLMKVPGLVCSCFPAETQTVATFIPDTRVPYIPLASIEAECSLEVSCVQEELTTVGGGCLASSHSGRRCGSGSASSWQGDRAVGNPSSGQPDKAGGFLRDAAQGIVAHGLFRECSSCYTQVMQSSIVWIMKHPGAIDTS